MGTETEKLCLLLVEGARRAVVVSRCSAAGGRGHSSEFMPVYVVLSLPIKKYKFELQLLLQNWVIMTVSDRLTSSLIDPEKTVNHEEFI